MPTYADTPVPARSRSVVLLGALTAAFAGLALTSAAPVPVTRASSSSLAAEGLHGAPLVTARALTPPTPVASTGVVAKPAPVRRATTRASRTRTVTGRWVRPVSAGVVSSYGMRWGRMHEGLDFGSGHGAPIRSVGDGVVVGAGYLASEGGYGNIVLVRHRSGAVTAYAHMSRVLVRAGERVRGGEVIGRVGSTGHSTGPHLHFEVRIGGAKVDPRPWLRRHGIRV